MDTPRRVNLGYSLKNIPLSSHKEYTLRLIERTEQLIKRMRWRAIFYLSGDRKEDDQEGENFGFKTRKCPPQVDEMKKFEDDMYEMIGSVTYRSVHNELQDKMKEDLQTISSSNDIIVPADKTRNLYKMPPEEYRKLLHDNITRNYQAAPEGSYDTINDEAKKIAADKGLEDRIDTMAKAEAFVTIKDHKENFPRNMPCRLINSAKSEIGVISKTILSGIVEALRDKPNINLWKNTSSVINWFRAIEEKASHTFVTFDIVDFYPSISENLLSLALAYAKQFVAIPDCDADIILHARQSLLFGANRTWAKKNRDGLFDVTMGSFDGAEACELVGAFLLGKLEQHFSSGSVGLYRDDGLAVLRNATGHSADKVRKAVIDTFKTLGLKITIDVNLNAVNYLDITMSLSTGTYQPYRKPNDTPLYVNVNSNHPPQVLKNIPAGINNRLASISCSEAVFRDAIPIYAE
eukprot:scpid84717/ scgid29334/ 